MDKRRLFIEQEKRWRKAFERKIEEMTPLIYAAVAISLHRRYGFGMKRLLDVLGDTRRYFCDASAGKYDIVKLCADETGINIISETTAKEVGVEGELV